MPTYMVERVLPGATMDAIEAIGRAAEKACAEVASMGKTVRYLRSTFTPGDSRCRCLFEAANADLVEEFNRLAQIPYSRVVLAVDFGSPASRAGETHES